MSKQKADTLTVTSPRELFNSEFLPNIRKEIRGEMKVEVDRLNASIIELTKFFHKVEESQQMLSDKYDSLIQGLQNNKKNVGNMQQQFESQNGTIDKLRDALYEAEVAIDEIQQYSRRDCLELSGFPFIPAYDANLIVEK